MGIFSSDEEPMWSDVYHLEDKIKKLEEENKVLEQVNKKNQEKIKRMNDKLVDMNIASQYGNEANFLLEEDLKQAEQKLEKIKEAVEQGKFYGEEYSPKYVLIDKILQIIGSEE